MEKHRPTSHSDMWPSVLGGCCNDITAHSFPCPSSFQSPFSSPSLFHPLSLPQAALGHRNVSFSFSVHSVLPLKLRSLSPGGDIKLLGQVQTGSVFSRLSLATIVVTPSCVTKSSDMNVCSYGNRSKQSDTRASHDHRHQSHSPHHTYSKAHGVWSGLEVSPVQHVSTYLQ